jgi:uncharacterized repeat protein (TIGR03803 family)
MHSVRRFHSSIFGASLRPHSATVAILLMLLFFLLVLLLVLLTPQPAQGQTYKVLHSFSGPDGSSSYAGVTLDAAGNLYGTTSGGGGSDQGTVFQLRHWHGNWILNSIFKFNGNNGYYPWSGVVFGPDGALYGTTEEGGPADAGVVYSLRPQATACKTALCPWTETVLHQFSGVGDGAHPGYGNLTFDSAGNLYGTTVSGGAFGLGTVFELMPSNGGWTESLLYSFAGGSDGDYPYSGVILDEAGNLCGTTVYGGSYSGYQCSNGCGTVYQLTRGSSGWKHTILYTFGGYLDPDGYRPWGGLIFDHSGNLYGTTYLGGGYWGDQSGTVFELSPAAGSWTFNLVYTFEPGQYDGNPVASLTMDEAGILYGTAIYGGAHSAGTVFKLTPSEGDWTYTSLYDFTGGNDGEWPMSSVTLDGSGRLNGTTQSGGNLACAAPYGCGVVWEITP